MVMVLLFNSLSKDKYISVTAAPGIKALCRTAIRNISIRKKSIVLHNKEFAAEVDRRTGYSRNFEANTSWEFNILPILHD